jgi:hypothetical protein
MDARRKTMKILNRGLYRTFYEAAPGAPRIDLHTEMPIGRLKLAAFGEGEDGPKGLPPTMSPGSRNIPKNHEYNPKALRPLAKMLWAMSVSLGHALTAYKQFTRLKSSTISPDGLLGGRGYVLSVKDVRKQLYAACEALSSISDTIHDEIQASHWKPKLEQLTRDEQDDVERFVGKAEKEMDRAEEFLGGTDDDDDKDEDEDEDEEGDDKKKSKSVGSEAKSPFKKYDDEDEDEDEDDPKSKLPGESDADAIPNFRKKPIKKVATSVRDAATAIRAALRADPIGVIANSSLPVETLPGPRVESLDRGNEPGPYGSWNREEEPSDDNYDYKRRGHDYVSDFENEPTEKAAAVPVAESAMPGTLTDKTETNTNDFGLGSNSGPRKGEGLEHGPATEQQKGMGVWGPHSGMPDDPSRGTQDPKSDHSQQIEVSLNSRNIFQANAGPLRGYTRVALHFDDANWLEPPTPAVKQMITAAGLLPNDEEDPVARSDYYPGEKGNLVNAESGMPGSGPKAKDTPLIQHPTRDESLVAESEMPGDGTNAPQDRARPMAPGTSYVESPDTSTAYTRWDDTTHDLRKDDWDQYQYSRPKSARTNDHG